jgi:hypothetical protein
VDIIPHNRLSSIFLKSVNRWEDFSLNLNWNYLVFRLQHRPIQLVALVPVGLSLLLWHLQQVFLVVKVSSIARPGQLTDLIWTPTVNCPGRTRKETSTINKTCRLCYKSNERPTGTKATNWMGRRWSLKIKVISIWL